jgi:hypothetical protein
MFIASYAEDMFRSSGAKCLAGGTPLWSAAAWRRFVTARSAEAYKRAPRASKAACGCNCSNTRDVPRLTTLSESLESTVLKAGVAQW